MVDIEMRGTNQRDVVTCPGTATVALPSREHGAVALPDPPADLQAQAIALMERHHELAAERKNGTHRGDPAVLGVGFGALDRALGSLSSAKPEPSGASGHQALPLGSCLHPPAHGAGLRVHRLADLLS